MLASIRIKGMVIPASMTSLTARLIMKRLVAFFWLLAFRHVRMNTIRLANTAMKQMIPIVSATPRESTPFDDDVIFR